MEHSAYSCVAEIVHKEQQYRPVHLLDIDVVLVAHLYSIYSWQQNSNSKAALSRKRNGSVELLLAIVGSPVGGRPADWIRQLSNNGHSISRRHFLWPSIVAGCRSASCL